MRADLALLQQHAGHDLVEEADQAEHGVVWQVLLCKLPLHSIQQTQVILCRISDPAFETGYKSNSLVLGRAFESNFVKVPPAHTRLVNA